GVVKVHPSHWTEHLTREREVYKGENGAEARVLALEGGQDGEDCLRVVWILSPSQQPRAEVDVLEVILVAARAGGICLVPAPEGEDLDEKIGHKRYQDGPKHQAAVVETGQTRGWWLIFAIHWLASPGIS